MRVIIVMMFVWSVVYGQVGDVCGSDSVVVVRSGDGDVVIRRRGCRQVLMSESTYRSFVLGSVMLDSLRPLVTEYVGRVGVETAARIRVEEELRSAVRLHGIVIDGYDRRMSDVVSAYSKASSELSDCKAALGDRRVMKVKAFFRGFGLGIVTGVGGIIALLVI
jgi:hypothetical protein